MKKLWLIPILAFLFACGPASMPEEAESTVGITAPDGYAVACIANYIRSQPHFCKWNGSFAASETWNVTSATGCNTHILSNVPTTATGVLVSHFVDLRSNNAIQQHIIIINYYNDATCITATSSWQYDFREFVAVGATTRIFSTNDFVLANNFSGVVTNTAFTSNSSSNVSFHILGYYD